MHELTLCYQTHELIINEANLQQATSVKAVWIEIGALSCVELESLRFCFDLVCKDSIAEGCELHLSQQTATAWCEKCKEHQQIETAYLAICSKCSSPLSKVDADDKVWVKKIHIE